MASQAEIQQKQQILMMIIQILKKHPGLTVTGIHKHVNAKADWVTKRQISSYMIALRNRGDIICAGISRCKYYPINDWGMAIRIAKTAEWKTNFAAPTEAY